MKVIQEIPAVTSTSLSTVTKYKYTTLTTRDPKNPEYQNITFSGTYLLFGPNGFTMPRVQALRKLNGTAVCIITYDDSNPPVRIIYVVKDYYCDVKMKYEENADYRSVEYDMHYSYSY